MESYIKKINDRVRAKHNEEQAKKIKKIYLIAGGLTLGIGLAGFVASFITFFVLFFETKTEDAFVAWMVAVPFILMIVAGSVVTRIGDMLLKDDEIAEVERLKKEEKQALKDKKISKKRLDKSPLIGAIVGDIAGSIYENNNIRTKDCPLFTTECKFTDDTVLSLAVYKAFRDCKGDYSNLSQQTKICINEVGRKYENCGYGTDFKNWLFSENQSPYESFGNGSAMRISAVAMFAQDINQVKKLSNEVTRVTHNHREGIKGAEATAVAIFLAKKKKSKEEIKKYIEENYYKLDFDYETLRKNYKFNETCQGTVPQAIYCFLISNSFEDCLRTSISIGGDSDTLCAISCAIAGQFYKVPKEFKDKAFEYLDTYLKGIIKK